MSVSVRIERINVNLVRCRETGIITCHGFSFEPFTTDRSLVQILKDYKGNYCQKNEAIGTLASPEYSLCYKCNENTSKNGSIKLPFTPVYLRRNLAQTSQNPITTTSKPRRSEKEIDFDERNLNGEVYISNGLSTHFSNDNMRVRFKAGGEDLLVRKRQKVTEEQEFENELMRTINSSP